MSSVSVGSLQAAPSSERPETTIGSRKAMRRAKRLSSCWCGVFITVATVSLALPKVRSNNLTDRCPLAFLLLAPIVKTFDGFLSQFPLAHHATQNIGRTKRFRAELAIQILSDTQTHVEAHQIGQAQRTHRVVITEFHRRVDVAWASHTLLSHSHRF